MADPTNIPPQVIQAVQRGNLIEAIKYMRQHKPQLGLAEAKALIEAIQKQGVPPLVQKAHARAEAAMHGNAPTHHALPSAAMNPNVSPGEMPRSGGSSVFAVLVVAIAVVVAAAVYFAR